MVRKVIICIMFLLSLLCLHCVAVSPYYGSISTTYLTYAKDVVSNHFWQDYVFYRSDYETYTLAIGDLEYSGGTFNGDVDEYHFTNARNSDNVSYIMYTTSSDPNFSLSSSGLLIYSNLGGYPSLMSAEVVNLYAILTVLLIMCIFVFLSRLYRSGRRK